MVSVFITCLFLSKRFNFFIVTIKFIFKCLDPWEKKQRKTNYDNVFYIRLYDLRGIRRTVDCLAKKLRGGGGRERGKVPSLSTSSFLLPFFLSALHFAPPSTIWMPRKGYMGSLAMLFPAAQRGRLPVT